MPLSITHLEAIAEALRRLPAVVDQQQNLAARFPDRVLSWLQDLEKTLTDARLQIVSEVASLRSRLLGAVHGSDLPAGLSRGKAKEKVASQVLQDAQRHVRDAIGPRLERLAEAEDIARRIAAVARAKRVVDQARTQSSHETALRHVVSVMRTDADTQAAMVHLEGILGPFELLIVLDRAIPELV